MFYEYFQKIHTFRVHTTAFAGNISREICAYVTATGDGTHGTALAKYVQQQEPDIYEAFQPYVTFLPDKSGYHRCCTLVPSPLEALGSSGEKGERDHDPGDGHADEGGGGDSRSDKYYSVGMFFLEKPPVDILELADKRAREYAQKQNEGELDTIARMAKFGPRDLEVVSTDFATYDFRDGVEVLWKSK